MPISIYVGFGTRGQEGDEGSGFETRQGRSASEDPPRQPCRWPRSAKRSHDASRSGPGMER